MSINIKALLLGGNAMLPIDEFDKHDQEEPIYEQLYIEECFPEHFELPIDHDDEERGVIIIEIV